MLSKSSISFEQWVGLMIADHKITLNVAIDLDLTLLPSSWAW